jgi:hypothetical protein
MYNQEYIVFERNVACIHIYIVVKIYNSFFLRNLIECNKVSNDLNVSVLLQIKSNKFLKLIRSGLVKLRGEVEKIAVLVFVLLV